MGKIMAFSSARLVLFDLDGTMLDARGAIIAAMASAFIRCNITPPKPAAIRKLIGLNLSEMVAALAGDRRDIPQSRIEAAYKEAYFSPTLAYAACDLRFPGLAAMLEAVDTPDTIMGIVTGKSRRGLEYSLSCQRLDRYFPITVTADDAASKPSGDMALLAMSEAGMTPHETVMVGDTTFDVEMAHSAGVPAIGVAWGYHGKAALEALGAPVADTMQDLPGIIDHIRPRSARYAMALHSAAL